MDELVGRDLTEKLALVEPATAQQAETLASNPDPNPDPDPGPNPNPDRNSDPNPDHDPDPDRGR